MTLPIGFFDPFAKRNHLPFIIFTAARTGSTTLTRVLNCHPAIRCEFEPFNPGYSTPVAFLAQTLLKSQGGGGGGGGLPAAIESIWQTATGIKHVWHADGWPFQDPALNSRLLTSGSTVILLHRKNALQRAVSVQISEQVGVWVLQNDIDRRRLREHYFTPLDIKKIRHEMTTDVVNYKKFRELIAATKIRHIEITYEEFFAPELSMQERMDAVQKLLDFLGLSPVTDAARLSAMQTFFDPDNTGFQNPSFYQRIPNIKEIDAQLSNPRTGLLFPAGPLK